MYLYFVDKIVQEKGSAFGVPLFESRLVELGITGRVEKMSMFKDARAMIGTLMKEEGLHTVVAVGNDATFFTVFDMAAQHEGLTIGFIPAVAKTRMASILGMETGLDACASIGRRLSRTLDVGTIQTDQEERAFFGAIELPAGAHVRCDGMYDVSAAPGTHVSIENMGTLSLLGKEGSPADYHDGKIEVVARAEKKERGFLSSKTQNEKSVFYCDEIRASAGGATGDCIVDDSVHIQLPFTVRIRRECLKLIVGKDSVLK